MAVVVWAIQTNPQYREEALGRDADAFVVKGRKFGSLPSAIRTAMVARRSQPQTA